MTSSIDGRCNGFIFVVEFSSLLLTVRDDDVGVGDDEPTKFAMATRSIDKNNQSSKYSGLMLV